MLLLFIWLTLTVLVLLMLADAYTPAIFPLNSAVRIIIMDVVWSHLLVNVSSYVRSKRLSLFALHLSANNICQ